jgi:hypothetical protein
MDDIADKINILLVDVVGPKFKDRKSAETAIVLMEQYGITKVIYSVRNLVHFPDLLKRYLFLCDRTKTYVDEDDLCSMFARSIEHGFRRSLKHLLAYNKLKPRHIKLMRGKYPIDANLYNMAWRRNVRDIYYDTSRPSKYHYETIVEKDHSGVYTGFRDVWHCLLYGDPRALTALIYWWEHYGSDCTADSAREFFRIDDINPTLIINRVKGLIRERSQKS